MASAYRIAAGVAGLAAAAVFSIAWTDADTDSLVDVKSSGGGLVQVSGGALIGAELHYQGGRSEIVDLHLTPSGRLDAVIVEHGWPFADRVAVAAGVVTFQPTRVGSGEVSPARAVADVTAEEFDMLSAGGGYLPIALQYEADLDQSRPFSDLVGTPVAGLDAFSIDDAAFAPGGGLNSVKIERGAFFAPQSGAPAPAALFEIRHDADTGWSVHTNATSGQVAAFTGSDDGVFLAAGY